ncbi:MAG: enoyl-CoA hydratase-related protein [Candidatus Eisenbacteria bacterium]
MNDSGHVRLAREGAVSRLTLHRPPLNVLDLGLNGALADALRDACLDPSVAALVIEGGDARGFSAGVEVADHTPDKVEGMLAAFHGAVRAVLAAPMPTLAAVHGFALGGGFELALACDLVVVEADARLGLPEIRLGAYPPIGAALLPARIGWARAAELVLGGQDLTAARALELGLINRVCTPGTLASATAELLAPILAHSTAVVREAKRALREGAAGGPDALARIEKHYLADLMRLADADEGIRAFLQKRPPRWQGR